MSAGRVHTKASLWLSAGFLLGAIVTLDIQNCRYAIGSLIGVVVTPDIDVDAGNDADKFFREKVGRWAEWLWKFFWEPYRRSLKHGGDLSHAPGIGTIGRLLYIYGFLIVVPHAMYWYLFTPSWDLQHALEVYFYAIARDCLREVIGLAAADLIHWALDIATTEHK